MNFKSLYKNLVKFSKDLHIPIRHLKKIDENDGLGCYDPINKKIYIKSTLKNTNDGVFVLAHELGHALDNLNGKHEVFFNFNDGLPSCKKNKKIIRRAEISASKTGLKLLKTFGFVLKKGELTNSVLDVAIDQDTKLSKHYFDNWEKDYLINV